MKNLENKKGISLIVLILTIIVMSILATAIILSLNNSGIIGKANKAKQASDTASLKEYVSVLRAEWELMSETERAGYEDDIDYVNAKLASKGYNRKVDNNGVLLPEGETATGKEEIQIGDEIKGYNDYLTVESINTVDITDASGATLHINDGPDTQDGESGVEVSQTIESKKFTTWRYIGVTDDGRIMITPDMTDSNIPTVILSGTGGYYNGPTALNAICQELYGTDKGTARSMNIDDVVNILEYTGPKGGYRYYNTENDNDPNNNEWMPLDEAMSLPELISAGYSVDPGVLGNRHE